MHTLSLNSMGGRVVAKSRQSIHQEPLNCTGRYYKSKLLRVRLPITACRDHLLQLLPPNPSNDLPKFKLLDAPEENTNGKQEPDVTNSPKTPAHSPKAPTHPTFVSSVKKPIGAKKVGGKTGGLGVRKLTTKVMLQIKGDILVSQFRQL